MDALHLAALMLPRDDLLLATWDRRLHADAGAEGLALTQKGLTNRKRVRSKLGAEDPGRGRGRVAARCAPRFARPQAGVCWPSIGTLEGCPMRASTEG